ncbi:4-hydroxy-3-methylbut-2-enyl diphosphate reductase [Tepidiforma thermophila]|uniref:4-hydroxy-3-methylbut-2-enyl diphosphate reductase n=1 Tax=Tepidiforma thermophila (strain KCTC 52669 / CGMCC 1.13589 / G233) TaxID=2761530 RepID=A0A2A9HGL0_TEPT2|nr:4-hydroxy-3-methylbut-2-enyl diphosphate reductase [Tepidiforma thermophila]PFG74106.1 4-hydroxy-3-methylbut-2-enyl diphosphate reductase [Tepidiforma thermophila]
MVQIIRASDMGFCMGVRRAVQIMESEASPERPVFSVGEIVHNPHVVRALERSGVVQLPGPDEVEGDIGKATAERVKAGRVAITAHGVGERVVRELEASGLEIIDTTCPIVTRAQRYGQKFAREGWHVLIYGDPGHKEVRGILGWTFGQDGEPGATVVPQSDYESLRRLVEEFPGGFPNKIGVMAQTTHKMEDFARFVANLMLLRRDFNFELHVVNTLCHATTGQQEAAAALAKEVDVMIVVGGKKSANTRHLREVAEEQGTRAYHIEGPEELQADWFAGVERIGLTAGASTPDFSVDAVEARIRELVGA